MFSSRLKPFLFLVLSGLAALPALAQVEGAALGGLGLGGLLGGSEGAGGPMLTPSNPALDSPLSGDLSPGDDLGGMGPCGMPLPGLGSRASIAIPLDNLCAEQLIDTLGLSNNGSAAKTIRGIVTPSGAYIVPVVDGISALARIVSEGGFELSNAMSLPGLSYQPQEIYMLGDPAGSTAAGALKGIAFVTSQKMAADDLIGFAVVGGSPAVGDAIGISVVRRKEGGLAPGGGVAVFGGKRAGSIPSLDLTRLDERIGQERAQCPPGEACPTVTDRDGIVCLDSDGDGVCEAEDQCAASPPGQAVFSNGCGLLDDRAVVLQGVVFKTSSAALGGNSLKSLRLAFAVLKGRPDALVSVDGHTDDKGDEAYNQRLSRERAKSVYDYFVRAGIDPARLTYRGFGESRPVEPNTKPDGSDNPEGRARNRRVELNVLKPDAFMAAVEANRLEREKLEARRLANAQDLDDQKEESRPDQLAESADEEKEDDRNLDDEAEYTSEYTLEVVRPITIDTITQ